MLVLHADAGTVRARVELDDHVASKSFIWP